MVAELAALPVFAWLVTYALHSTLLLALAWLVTRCMDARALGRRERAWKFAVLGGLASAALQVGAGFEPLLGRVELALASDVPAAPVQTSPIDASSAAAPARLEQLLAVRAALDAIEAAPPPSQPAARDVEQVPGPILAPESAREALAIDAGLPLVALASWILVVLASAGLVAFGLGRLRRELAGAFELEQGPQSRALARLATRAGLARRVRLLIAPRLAAPLSTGWLRPRICLPPRALEELSCEELEAVLAHEVAHLARRDPPWLFLLWLIETVCFFQPLNRLARRELSASFELSADAWAARATGDRLALAACLARIAGWIVGASAPGVQRAMGAAMADALDGDRPRSRLGERILRLLDPAELARDDRPGRVEGPLALALLGALALAVPGVAAVLPAVERAALELAPALDGALGPGESIVPAADASDEAQPGVPAGGEGFFDELDAEMAALDEELELLRAELSGGEPDPRWSAVLEGLEARTQRLEDRRSRMQVVLEALLMEEAGHDARRFGP